MLLDIALTLAAALLGCFLLLRWLMACGLGLPMEDSFFALEPRKHRISSYPGEKALYRRENAKIFLTALAFRLAMLLLGYLILLLVAGDSEPRSLESAMMNGDGYHYLQLVEKGYSGYTENGEHLFLVFFPLYVWFTQGVNLLVGNAFVSGLMVSFLCYSAACVFVYRLAREEMNRRSAQRAVVFLSVFPFAFFFGGMMTESLFLLTTSASLLYLRRLPWALLPFLGTGAYLLLNYVVDGDPFAFVTHQQHWYQGFLWFSQTLQYVGTNAFFWGDLTIRAAVWLPQLILFVVFFGVLALCWRRFPASLTLYAFFYLILNYSLSWLLSGGRYLSCDIPFFLFAAALTEKRPSLDRGVAAGMAVLLGVYYFAWLSGVAIY